MQPAAAKVNGTGTLPGNVVPLPENEAVDKRGFRHEYGWPIYRVGRSACVQVFVASLFMCCGEG